MALKHELERLHTLKEYKEFIKKNKEAYLAHAFIMLEKGNRSEWQIGYYLPKKDKVVTFFMLDKLKMSPESKIFKEPKAKIHKLDMNNVKQTLTAAIEKALELQKQKYPTEQPAKMMCILQHLESGTIYNITFVTPRFSTLNIKIDAVTLEIKSDKLTNILQFGAN